MKIERPSLLLIMSLNLATVLFVVDLVVPLGWAIWLSYVAVVVLSLWLPRPRSTYLTAALCTCFTGCALLLSPRDEVTWMIVVNRSMAVVIFWIVAAGGLSIRRARELEKANTALQEEIARRERLEAQLLRTQRLESIGVLAGGIAHDFNNLLSPILMSIKLLRKDRPEEDREHLLLTLQASAERAADMVRQLLSFAGGVEGQRGPLQLGRVFKEVHGIIQHTFPRNIEIQTTLAADLRPVLADATQISQVLLNLCVNARDAMPHGGVLAIVIENVDLSEATLVSPEARPGPHVRIAVTDTGTGMPPDVLDRVFDPFFTTKEQGKGTGLGLSTVLGIVKTHGGFIQVASEVGHGTRFEVYLPGHLAPSVVPDRPPCQALEGRGEAILLVDDESLLVTTVKATLEGHGYRVVTARDGQEALNAYEQHRGQIDAVLLDMMMPRMDGSTTLTALRQRDPHLPVIASSGLRPGSAGGETIPGGIPYFLPKPYTDEQLLTTLANVLHPCQASTE